MIERVLRGAAIAIAALAILDPPLPVSASTRPRLSIIAQGGSSMDLPGPASSGPQASRRAVAEHVRTALQRALRDDYDITDGRDVSANAAIVIGDRYPEEPPSEAIPVSTVTVSGDLSPNVRIAAIRAPAAVLPATAVPIRVLIEASGVRGSTTTVRMRMGGAEIGRASHAWTADRESWTTAFEGLPIGEPPYAFEAVVEPLPQERTEIDNRAIARVDRSAPARVFVLDARPSWASAFVRRALEGDSRFIVDGVTRASRRAAIRTGGEANWPMTRLDDADVVIVGGLDQLSKADVDLLDRFMRVRGGAVVLLPDVEPSGEAVRTLLGGVTLRQVLLDRPAALAVELVSPRIAASELLEAETLPQTSTVVASTSAAARPVIWATDRGEGTLLFSGAMDAWRHRADPQVEFDRFWRSIVSGLALAARPPVEVTIAPARAAPGDRITVTARVRRLEREQLNDSLWISARTDGGTPIRMWPDARPGVFIGSFVVDKDASASRRITAAIGDGVRADGSARFDVDPAALAVDGAPLSMLAESHGGVDVGPSDLVRLERHLRTTVRGQPERAIHHPMRSPWWIVPFAGCVSAEWWLRRRRGQR